MTGKRRETHENLLMISMIQSRLCWPFPLLAHVGARPAAGRSIWEIVYGDRRKMIRLKAASAGEMSLSENAEDRDDKLVLMDDVMFVNAFAQAAHRRGRAIVCVGCFDPSRALRAFVFRLEGPNIVDESSGSLGFCFDCYRDLMERVFHDSVLRASKHSGR
jgi:hypothetical protein